MNDSVTHL